MAQIHGALNPRQLALFTRMQPSEQAHSLQVYRKLKQAGETHPGLLAAALLHDAGKSLYPLSIWQRVLIVLVRAFLPEQVKRWGSVPVVDQKTPAWQLPLIVSEQHPAWGADLAAAAGASPLTVALIRRHQENPPAAPGREGRPDPALEDRLLGILISVDNES